MGIGGSLDPEVEGRKSISCERTFQALSHPADLNRKLEELAESLANEMSEEGLMARTLTLKLKTTAFEVRTRAFTLPKYIASRDEILPPALRLLQAELPISVRLIGLRLSNFKGEKADPHQQTLSSFFTIAYGTDSNLQDPVTSTEQVDPQISHVKVASPRQAEVSMDRLCGRNTGHHGHVHPSLDQGCSAGKSLNLSGDNGTPRTIDISEDHNEAQPSPKWQEGVKFDDWESEGKWGVGEGPDSDCETDFDRRANAWESSSCLDSDLHGCHVDKDRYDHRQNLIDDKVNASSHIYRVNTRIGESVPMERCIPDSSCRMQINDSGNRSQNKLSIMDCTPSSRTGGHSLLDSESDFTGRTAADCSMRANCSSRDSDNCLEARPLCSAKECPASNEPPSDCHLEGKRLSCGSSMSTEAKEPLDGPELGSGKVEWTHTVTGMCICSVCGETVTDSATVEHEDFHLAQMLHEREMRDRRLTSHTHLIQTGNRGRTSNTPPRGNTRKRRKSTAGVNGETDGQKCSRVLTLDSFLVKTSRP